MADLPSPAQRAVQVTFILKGHLKNARIAYIRAAVLLAKVRDEKLWQALRHPSIADYARKRLRLGESALYKYLQVHDWLKKYHPSWLARRPKGFIPELSDVEALAWIEKHLEDPHLGIDGDQRAPFDFADLGDAGARLPAWRRAVADPGWGRDRPRRVIRRTSR